MSRPLGVIAGSGDFPFFICREAARAGRISVVAAISGQASPDLEAECGTFEPFELRRAPELAVFFRKHAVREVVFAGKIDPRTVFETQGAGGLLPRLLGLGSDSSPATIIEKAIRWLAGQGIEVIDPSPFLKTAFCPEGRLSRARGDRRIENDIDFGWDKARALADYDIGQTLVVKQGAVVAVEGLEGTDSAIRRGGELAGPGVVVIKLSRTLQDPRIDLPAVGLDTVRSLIAARAAALCLEAGRMPFFRREEAVDLADKNRLVLIARA